MTVTAHSECVSVAMDTNATHARIAKSHNKQFSRTKYMAGLLLRRDRLFALCRQHTHSADTKLHSYKRTKHARTHTHAHANTHTELPLHTRKTLCHSLSFYSHFLRCPCHCYDTPVITLPTVSCQTAFWLMCFSFFLEALQAGYSPT